MTLIACQTPSAGWVNLAHVRQLKYKRDRQGNLILAVVWSNGDKQVFTRDNAATIIQAWRQAIRT
ncbi:MAG: hypothetical protein KME28_13980 [Pelatocladus maniniholoensis HA4357-MV3]|jgi:hypothetical protein|uniref:Uncharacterized protein n=1 Tax=Pelatocladus maniniholoensis HA4357-MV3 TaxID=1117104 RepID=A0A9E3H8M3_9NOST|nr:hypothetical protein [Pelatocladus maniniholoensis HA4357-MV3]BAZ69156.1 hypothetical protein NIES4106_39270 [Fischerella sp. NIES-4106]